MVMSFFVAVALLALFLFSLGVLVGSGLAYRAQEERGRQQAAVQRELNAQWQALRERKEATANELC